MINTWVLISRDPGIQKGPIISSRAQSLLEGYLKGSSRIDWDKVEDGSHPFAELYEEVWGDVEDYENWLMDIKGKVSKGWAKVEEPCISFQPFFPGSLRSPLRLPARSLESSFA